MSNIILRALFRRLGQRSHYSAKIIFANGSVYETHPGKTPDFTLRFKKRWAQWWSIIFFNDGALEMYVKGHLDVSGKEAFGKIAVLAFSAFVHSHNESKDSFSNPLMSLRKWWQEKTQNNTNREVAMRNADFHYANHPALFEQILGNTVGYSEGYWTPNTKTLDQAKHNIYEYICRKLQLAPGMRVVEVGHGWGFMTIYMVKNYDVDVVVYNPVKRQNDYLEERAKRYGVSDRIKVILGDHRDIAKEAGSFDRFVTIGVHEHHGYDQKQYDLWWNSIKMALKPDGIGVISTSGYLEKHYTKYFTLKYIWPGGHLPCLPDELRALQHSGLTLIEIENLWPHYQKTTAYWDKLFERNWDKIQKADPEHFTEQFRRAWTVYLGTITEVFSSGLDNYHIIFANGRNTTNYPWTHEGKYLGKFTEGEDKVECYSIAPEYVETETPNPISVEEILTIGNEIGSSPTEEKGALGS